LGRTVSEVDALNGEPGIYSARYSSLDPVETSGTDKDHNNNLKLLRELNGVEVSKRTARFHCVLAFVRHATDPNPIICQGAWEGRIQDSLDGEGGFGYDPLFFVESENCTAAELSKEHKNRISHRGSAMQQLIKNIKL